MEFKFTFLPEFHKTLKKLPKDEQEQIVKKISDISKIKDQSIFRYIKPLAMSMGRWTHRLRVGNNRIFFQVIGNNFEIHNVIRRKDAYK